MESQIGPYQLDAEIGRGGMGVVYRALDTRLDRIVAIKVLPSEVSQDPMRLDRFEREARALAQLNHPNLAGIHGLEEHDGAKYLVLEYVEGETLADRLDRGVIPPDEAVEFAAQVASGIEAAHEAGVVHRDLKPSNIMITPDGQAKVLDFGLARQEEHHSSTGTNDAETISRPSPHSPTIPGAILGTAAYMSPEQARGRRVDKRTDIWSFGVVLYEMLVGASPFVGETASDTIGAVLHKNLDLEMLPAATPSHVRRVLERCLERDRNLRFRDIGDVRLELVARPVNTEHADRATGNRGVSAVGWVLAVAFAAVALVVLLRPTPETPSVSASLLAPDGVRILNIVLSPDGTRVVMIAQVFNPDREDASFRGTAFIRDLSDGTAKPIENIFDPFCAGFSPDGRWLVFASNTDRGSEVELYRLPSDLSGSRAKIGAIPDSASVSGRQWFSWTPASEIVYLDGDAEELVVVNPGVGDLIRRVPILGDGLDNAFGSFVGPFGDRWISIGDPVFSEDGYREDAVLIDVYTGETTKLLQNAGNALLVGSDRLLFSRGSQVFESRFDLKNLQLSGEIRPVHEGLATSAAWSDGVFQVSDSGMLAYLPGGVRGTKRSIVLIDLDFNETLWSDEQRAFERGINRSSDGERLAVVVSSSTGLFEVWVADSERRRFRRLLSERGHDFNDPRFTPDGEFVIATRDVTGTDARMEVVVMPFNGDGVYQTIYVGEQDEDIFPYGVSSDGQWLLISARSPSGFRKFMEIPIIGEGQPRELEGLHSSITSMDYAPDGVPLIAYVSSESGIRQMYVRRLEDGQLGAEIPVSDEDVLALGWHESDGSTITFSYLRADRTVLKRSVSIDGGIRIGASEVIQERASRLADVGFAPNIGGAGIKHGEDEGPITRVNIITNWLDSLQD